MEKPTYNTLDAIKHALISIAIGAAISIITMLFQYLVDLLHGLQPAVPGVVAGVGKYLYSWSSQRNV